jgi:phage tail-like protein
LAATGAYQHLNVERRWAGFELRGLEVGDDGALRLAGVPSAPESLGPALGAGVLGGPAGIAVDADGNVYVADAARHLVLRVDACFDTSAPFGCVRGPGSAPGFVREPRGVLAGPRDALYVADSGNHRVQIFDRRTGQLRGVWGQPDPWSAPEPSDADGRFRGVWDLAADAAGNVYTLSPRVVDADGTVHPARVQKFGADGRVEPAFWAAMAASRAPTAPTALAAVVLPGAADVPTERLLVLDPDAGLLVYTLDGEFDPDASARWGQLVAPLAQPAALAAAGGRLYVGDAVSGQVLIFTTDARFVGFARGVERPAAGLAVDRLGRLLVHPGAGGAVHRLSDATSFLECGSFVAGPFTSEIPLAEWHRLRVAADDAPAATHVRLLTLTSDTLDGRDAAHRPLLPALCGEAGAAAEPATASPTPLDRWRAAVLDTSDLLVFNARGRYLWVAGELWGDGTTTPALRQIRLEYAHEGWMRHLPALYRRDDEETRFLERTLALFETALTGVEEALDGVSRYLDPAAAPDRAAGAAAAGPAIGWLAWLAGWLDLELDERWDDDRRRRAVAGAFELHAARGTTVGIARLVELTTGVPVTLAEPAHGASLWRLDDGALGLDTMLAPAHPQGAVLGATAMLERARLLDVGDGSPLFDDLAHRFTVRCYAADLGGPRALDRVREVIDRERPAHTSYHLCVVRPRMRVGAQARLGIDAIVAGPALPLALDGARSLGADFTLPGAAGSAMGRDARVGQRTILR